MTQEQKAKELYYYHCTEKSCNGFNNCKNCPKSKVKESLLKMAAWKEQQIIEKAVNYLENMLILDNGCSSDKFIADFKKAMKEI